MIRALIRPTAAMIHILRESTESFRTRPPKRPNIGHTTLGRYRVRRLRDDLDHVTGFEMVEERDRALLGHPHTAV